MDGYDIQKWEKCNLIAKSYDLDIHIIKGVFEVSNRICGIYCSLESLDELSGFLKGFKYYYDITAVNRRKE